MQEGTTREQRLVEHHGFAAIFVNAPAAGQRAGEPFPLAICTSFFSQRGRVWATYHFSSFTLTACSLSPAGVKIWLCEGARIGGWSSKTPGPMTLEIKSGRRGAPPSADGWQAEGTHRVTRKRWRRRRVFGQRASSRKIYSR